MDFPGANIWVWIGDSSATLSNLSLGLQHRFNPKETMSTTLVNPSGTEDTVSKSRSLSQRLTKLLKGRPVYLSYSITELGLAEDLLNLSDMEAQLFQLLKKAL